MADGKWIPDLTPDMQLEEAARCVLRLRLEIVRANLQRAVHQADEDPEYIHQLRVGTRRSGAALTIFGDCIPRKIERVTSKHLRRLRRAAGAARDQDVFLMELRSRLGTAELCEQAGLNLLVGQGFLEREQAQEVLRQTVCPERLRDFECHLADVLEAIRQPRGEEDATLVSAALAALPALLLEFNQAVAGDLDEYEQLHQVRIIGKRLRYAMEVFATCFPPEFREAYYPAVEEMQDILGLANDSFVASRRLQHLRQRLASMFAADWPRWQPGVEQLLTFHEDRLPAKRHEFLLWWERWKKQEEAFLAMLDK